MAAHVDTPTHTLVPIPGTQWLRAIPVVQTSSQAPLTQDEQAILALHAELNRLRGLAREAHAYLQGIDAAGLRWPSERMAFKYAMQHVEQISK